MIARILLIEDDQDLLELFADALNQNGFSVDRFTDPLQALSVFERNPNGYDLVLSDIRMPGISGLDLVRKMKDINPNVNFALMSAFETDSFRSELGELELSSFMKKPMHIDQLVNAVRGCVANSSRVSRSEKFR
ncbi:MAG TPA: response regulator [Nitrososphaeraceae archaeon]